MKSTAYNRVLVAFGSNLGDREQHIMAGLQQLEAISGSYCRCSSWWGSAPSGMTADAGEFINGVVAFDTWLTPQGLLAALQGIEQHAGRPALHEVNASRVLDLDILCFNAEEIHLPELQIPHPRMTERLFVLMPLAELAPDLVLPGQVASLADLIRQAPGEPLSLLRAGPVLRPRPLP
jgi:2-amino-4-hydroxy-6-hydroxymethyldihydropteridine diphosphokinase